MTGKSSTPVTDSISARHLYSLPVVSGCALDPSKTFVAYVVTTLDEASNTYRGSIKVVGLADGQVRTLSQGTARDGAPRWSADGSSLIFSSDRSGSTQLWRVDLAGGEPQALPTVPGNVSEFAVAPDGARIAVITTPTTQRDEVERRGWRRITRLRYRADGLGYLDDMPQLWLIDVSAGSARAVTDGAGYVGSPAWDSAGQSVAFSGEYNPDADSLWRTELWTASASHDWQPRKVVALGSAIDEPAWSHDGTRIAFGGINERNSGSGLTNFRLYTVGRDGHKLECLTPDEEWNCGNHVLTDVSAAGGSAHPVWLSENEIAVIGSSRGIARVFAVTVSGDVDALTPSAASVTEFACVDRSSLVVCASDSATPPELYIVRENKARRLTHETDAWCEPIGVAAPVHFRVSAPGGDIDAWHFEGRSHEHDRRPCILQIHGGPHFAYGDAYVFEFVLLAAAGFDVVYCNPRGSQTYGEPFAAAIQRDWGRPALEDCTAALDAAIERFAIDPKRLGIAGGSYGGYLTAFAIGHTTRFAAAIAMRPASNLTSLWGTSEVGRMLAEDFGGRPRDVPDVYHRDSVLTYADAIETPLLIIHSENDYRTPTEQSEQLFTALRERGATVEVMRFTKADHGLSRTGPPQQRVARLEAIVDWFRRYLEPS
ncbi:MAG TPA: S9 family peptidase [Candidatus Eremiobacteraceae bacterium]|nr:S9 family peptidase [Candidatus Eremiobacteraceae bacterium]